MTSRLFHAIVGFGIALGASGVACLGAVSDPPAIDGAETPPAPTSPGAPPMTTVDGAPARDAGIDSTLGPDADAAADAPRDAILDAFCDAAWPTTKGNPGPTCGPIAECAEAGPTPQCHPLTAPLTCETRMVPVWCVAGKWECSTGSVVVNACKCWGTPDAGATCP